MQSFQRKRQAGLIEGRRVQLKLDEATEVIIANLRVSGYQGLAFTGSD